MVGMNGGRMSGGRDDWSLEMTSLQRSMAVTASSYFSASFSAVRRTPYWFLGNIVTVSTRARQHRDGLFSCNIVRKI